MPHKEYAYDTVAIRPGWSIAKFDLTEPLDAQLARAASSLKQIQEVFLHEIGAAERLKEKTKRRLRKDRWPLYLRVLDARNEGASYKAIGTELKGIDCRDLSKMSQQHADRLLSRTETARIDARRWHETARKIANNRI